MELINFLRVLYRKKWLIFSVVGVAVISTILFTNQLPETFQSKGKLSLGISDNVILTPNERENIPQYVNMGPKFSALLDLIKSTSNLSLVSYDLFLHDFETGEPFSDISKIKKRYSDAEIRKCIQLFHSKLENMEPLTEEEREDIYLDMLKLVRYDPKSIRKGLRIEVDAKLNHFIIGYVSQERFLSAYVVNSLMNQFIRFYKQVDEKKSTDATEFLGRLVEQKKKILNAYVDRQVTKIAEEQKDFPPENARRLIIEHYELQMEQEAEKEKYRILQQLLSNLDAKMKESEKKFLRDAYEGNDVQIMNLKDELELLTEKKLEAMVLRRPQSNIQDSFSAVRNQIKKVLLDNSSDSFTELSDVAKDRINHRIDIWLRLEETQIVQQYINKQLSSLNQRAPKLFANLKENENITKEKNDYLDILTKLNRAKITSLNPGIPVFPVEEAIASQTPIKEKNSTLVLLAGSVSFIVCIIFVFFQEYLDINLRSPYLFGKFSGLSNYGSLNMLDNQHLDLPRLFRNTQSDASLETFKQNLRKIRFELLATGAKYFLFTSTQPRTGKSAIMLALAYSFSLNYKKVLLIDTNLKDPDLTQVCRARPHLEKYFKGEVKLNQVISHSGLPNVDIIGSEGNHPNPEEFFSSDEFSQFLNNVGRDYDFVFLEGANMNQTTETKFLIRHVDKVLAIFSSRSSLKQADKASIHYLKKMDQKVGTILNFLEINETS